MARLPRTPIAAALLASALAIHAGCGGATPPPKEEGGIPLTASSATAAPHDDHTAAPAASSAPAAASSAPEEKKARPMGGAPMAVTEDDKEVTATYGARGGKIRIGGLAELIVPVDAVDQATNFVLGLNTGKSELKITPFKGQLGGIYRIGVARPDNPKEVASAGSPFVLKLPLPKGTKTANLVIALPAGGKLGKYHVIAPKGVEEGASGSLAVFELPKIVTEAMIHLTSSPPSAGE